MVTQKKLTQAHKLKLRWFVAMSSLPLLGVVTAFGIMPQTQIATASLQIQAKNISLPESVDIVGSATTFWHTDRVHRGDTVAELLHRLNIDDSAASVYLRKNKTTISLRQLHTGMSLQAETGADGSLLALRYLNNSGKQVMVERTTENLDGFKLSEFEPTLEQHHFLRSGVIKSTLFAATDEAGLPYATASQLVKIFGGDIDFHRDLRKGDRFSVSYEVIYINGEPVHTGRIEAAEFVNKGRAYRVVYFQTDKDHGDYYTPNGKSIRKAFLRSPVEFSRISSGFTSARFHPILKKWRAHKGVDYAAPKGTRVKVTADGIVSFVGKQGGYGNVIMVDHPEHHTTVYAHLSRFASGLHRGQRVGQGDIIGYVGMTGWATGPHLHYEFRINGKQHDPLRVALPSATPIDASQRAAFQDVSRNLIERLGLMNNINLAKID